MSKWSKFKKFTNSANNVRRKAENVKNTTKDVTKDGVGKAAKNILSKKSRKKAFKWGGQTLKAFGKFLITPPWGWVVSAILISSSMWLFDSLDGTDMDVGINETQGDNLVTEDQYAAMINTGCASPVTKGKAASNVELSGNHSKYSIDEVVKFATSPLTSTWKVSEKDAEGLFLSRNSRVASFYGLDASNIGKVTAVIKKEGVSPTFFYLYAVSEGGGAGGFINHYFQKDMTGEALADAKMDAEYLVQYANMVGGTAATETWSLGNMPTKKPQEILDKMPNGSIGRVYIQATAAVSAELNELSGIDWPRVEGFSFGHPITDMMNMITSVGGDISSAEQIDVGSFGSGAGELCNPSEAGGDLKSGGLSLDEARAFMVDKYYGYPVTMADIPTAAHGSPTIHDNCTAFVAFFLKHYTSITPSGGNGRDVVRQLVAGNPQLKESKTPTVYSVFSIEGNTNYLAPGEYGHTGIILGIDTEKGVAILGQAGYGLPFSASFVAMEYPLDKIKSEGGWSFADVSEYVKGI